MTTPISLPEGQLPGGLRWPEVKDILDEAVGRVNRPSFVENDPISIPYLFEARQDVEIAGLFAAIFAWGQRKTAISKARQLMRLMGDQPHQFVLHASDREIEEVAGFRHRTFSGEDAAFFLKGLGRLYRQHGSMEDIFKGAPIKEGLCALNGIIFEDQPGHRSQRHLSSPDRKSSCKRLNMFLRWMVRRDGQVDLGLWRSINPSMLICPLDVHVGRSARALGLLTRPQDDWQAAEELTANLRLLDPEDPVKYDFALFGLSLEKGVPQVTR